MASPFAKTSPFGSSAFGSPFSSAGRQAPSPFATASHQASNPFSAAATPASDQGKLNPRDRLKVLHVVRDGLGALKNEADAMQKMKSLLSTSAELDEAHNVVNDLDTHCQEAEVELKRKGEEMIRASEELKKKRLKGVKAATLTEDTPVVQITEVPKSHRDEGHHDEGCVAPARWRVTGFRRSSCIQSLQACS